MANIFQKIKNGPIFFLLILIRRSKIWKIRLLSFVALLEIRLGLGLGLGLG
jgi:hypothetical protein